MTVVASAVAPAASAVKKASKAKKTLSTHPPYGDMIKRALKELKERGGSSRQAIAKFIKAHYKVDDRVEIHLRRALVAGVKSGKLAHTKGIGASGSFKLAEKAASPKKAVARPKSVKPKTTPKKKVIKKTKTAAKPKVASAAPSAGGAKAAPKPKVSKTKTVKPKKAKTPKKPKALKPKKPVAKKTPKKVVKK